MKKENRLAVTFGQVIDTDRQLQSFNLQKCQEAPKVCGEPHWHLSSLLAPLRATARQLPSVEYRRIDLFVERLWFLLNIHSFFFPFHHRFIVKKCNLSPLLFVSHLRAHELLEHKSKFLPVLIFKNAGLLNLQIPLRSFFSVSLFRLKHCFK